MKINLEIQTRDLFNIDKQLTLNLDDFINFNVPTSCVDESNKFLNCLWEEFNEKIPAIGVKRCLWAYLPAKYKIKHGFITYFGSMKTQIGYIHVAISYNKKGTIKNIFFFSFDFDCFNKEKIRLFKSIIKNSKERINVENEYIFECSIVGNSDLIEANMKLQDYEGKEFKIYSTGNSSNIQYNIISSEKSEALEKAKDKLRDILNFLAIETNMIFNYSNEHVKLLEEGDNIEINFSEPVFQEEIYEKDPNALDGKFMDFIPNNGNDIVLSKLALKFIDRIIVTNRATDKNLGIYLNGCFHFKNGLEREFILEKKMIEVGTEACIEAFKLGNNNIVSDSITAYLSAIETVTLINQEGKKCETCGQLKFNISQRVSDFIKKYLWEDYGMLFKKIYNLRSLYLHTGKPYTKGFSTIRPLLDESTGTGCIDTGFISLTVGDQGSSFTSKNVREWTSFSFRNYYKDNF